MAVEMSTMTDKNVLMKNGYHSCAWCTIHAHGETYKNADNMAPLF